MVKEHKQRIVFLCSGGGGNLRFIYRAIQLGLIANCEIVAVITDRHCQASEFASKVGVPNICVTFDDLEQSDLRKELKKQKPHIIITTIHKIISPSIVDEYRGRLINLHYSLLPAFPGVIGMTPVKMAIEYNSQIIGVTTHFVHEKVDVGAPIIQVAIPIKPKSEKLDNVMGMVFKCGCLALMSTIDILTNSGHAIDGFVHNVEDRACLFSGVINVENILALDEEFWVGI